MRSLILAAAVLLSVPALASAQGVSIGPGGVTVETRPATRERYDEIVPGYERRTYVEPRYRERRVEGEYVRCRTITKRHVNAYGESVVRRKRVCG